MRKVTPASFLLSVLIVGGLFWGLMQLAKSPRGDAVRASVQGGIKASWKSFRDSLFYARKAPLTTIELEANLQNSCPDPFAQFSPQDWQWFWKLLYGRVEDKSRWPRTTRQMTQDEVEAELAYSYPQPFANFREEQWAMFWGQILKGKVF
ncbi:MAG: hypothetical protein V1727_02440 [Candidatus Omnitrophota bacterium]